MPASTFRNYQSNRTQVTLTGNETSETCYICCGVPRDSILGPHLFPSWARAPGYQLSPDHFQRVKRMPSPNWAQKMLCIIMPNRLRAIPEFSSWAGQHISIRNLWQVPPRPPTPIPDPSLCYNLRARKHKISHLQLHIPDNYRLGKAVNDKSQRDFPVVAVCDFYQI